MEQSLQAFSASHRLAEWSERIALCRNSGMSVRKWCTKTNIQTDSYVAVQLLQIKRTLDLSALQEMAETVEGSFSFTVLDRENQLYFIKGDNPLCICHYPRLNLYVYASTAEILNRAVTRMGLSKQQRRQLDLISR